MDYISKFVISVLITASAVANAAPHENSNASDAGHYRIVKVGEEPSSPLVAGAVVGKNAVMEMMKAEEPQSVVPDMVGYARRFLGARYRHGAKGPKSFDCSGFTSYIFKEFGYKLSPSSSLQYKQGVSVRRDEVRPGDLLFFSGRRVSKNVGHVGMVIEVNPDGQSIKFIHATIGGGVKIDTYPDGGYYSKRYIGARRVLSDDDLGDI